MAKPIRLHAAVAPSPRLTADDRETGYFYPREAAEIVGCLELDYHQLRRLFRLVRAQAGKVVSDSSWARYTLRDIAALRVAIELAGGRQAMQPGRRLQLAAVERACEALKQAGVVEPLLEVPLVRQGRAVFAVINGSIVDPTNGQGVLREVFENAAAWLADHEATVLDRLRLDRDRTIAEGRPQSGRVQVSG